MYRTAVPGAVRWWTARPPTGHDTVGSTRSCAPARRHGAPDPRRRRAVVPGSGRIWRRSSSWP